MRNNQTYVEVLWREQGLLGLGIVLLWSYGRIVNPLTQVAYASGHISLPLQLAMGLYVLMHLVLFVYSAMLLARAYRRSRSTRRSWALGLSAYVCVSLVVSLYFLGYQYGYVSDVFSWVCCSLTVW